MMRPKSSKDPIGSSREKLGAQMTFTVPNNRAGLERFSAYLGKIANRSRASRLAEQSPVPQLHLDSRKYVLKSRLGPPTPEDSSEDVSLTRNTDNLAALPPEPAGNRSHHKTVNSTQRNIVRTPTSSPPVSQSRKRPRPESSPESQTTSSESQSPGSQDLKRRRGRPPGSLNKKKSDPSRNASATEHIYRSSPTRGDDTHEPFRVSHTLKKQLPIPDKQHDPAAQHEQKRTGTSQNIGPRLYNFNYYRPDFEIEESVDDLGTASVIKRRLSRSRYEFEALFVEEIQPLIRQAMKESEGKLSPKDLLTTGRKVN